MKKYIVVILILISIISFGQGKKIIAKQPSFKISFDKFESKYKYNAETGNIGIYAESTANDFTDITFQLFTLTVYDSYLTYASGIILLFSDGTTMNLSTKEQLGENAGKGLWRYYALATLNPEQWLELSNKTIVSYKFDIFERKYKNGIQFKALVNNFYE